MTLCRIGKKSWFSVRESGVGGVLGVVPMARKGMGGLFGRRERRAVLLA